MNVQQAAAQLKEYYELTGSSSYEIVTGVVDKGLEGIPLVLFEKNGVATLTDCAEVANGVGENLTEEELESVSHLFGFSVNDWHIEKTYEGVDDVKKFCELVETIFPQNF